MKQYGCSIGEKKYRQEQYSQKESKQKIKNIFQVNKDEEEMSTDDQYKDPKSYQEK